MFRNLTGIRWIPLMALLVVAAVGCGGQYAVEDESSSTAYPSADATAEIEATEEMLAVLSRADRVDGVADQVIERCPGCGLAMEGSADHAVAVGDYQLHFCSDTCQEHFREDAETALLALNVPDPPPMDP